MYIYTWRMCGLGLELELGGLGVGIIGGLELGLGGLGLGLELGSS